MSDDSSAPDFANNPPPLYPVARKKGRAIPGQTHEVSGGRVGEILRCIGLVDKGNSAAIGAYVHKWRGSTRLELHELERTYSTFSRSGRVLFIHFSRIDELISLLEQARDFARSLPAPKVRRASPKTKRTERNCK